MKKYEHNEHNNLKRGKYAWMLFTILFFIATIFLLILNNMAEKRIGKLQERIEVLESAFVNAKKEDTVLVPNGRGEYKIFDIIERF